MKRFFIKISNCFFIILLILLLILTPISLCDDLDDNEVLDVNQETLSIPTTTENSAQIPDINSRACVVIDRNSNTILYGKNENEKRKMASTTKIMTALIIIENCNLNETINVSKKAANTGGSRLGLKTNDKITIKDLLYGLMLCSGNDAAVALAEYAGKDINGFAELMNKKANKLHLYDTHFETPHGLDSGEHYTTAYELALLTNYALNNKIFSQIVGTKNYTVTINGNPKNISNTNELLGYLDGVYGVKTGFTNGANRCLVTACKRENMDIICVVLGADTKRFRTQDSIKLINYVMTNFEPVNFQKLLDEKFEEWKKENYNSLIINKGSSNNIDLKAIPLEHETIPVRKDYIKSIDISLNINNYFEAPLYENTEIGNIKISWNDNNSINSKIINTNTINKKSLTTYFLYFIKDFPQIIQNCLN